MTKENTEKLPMIIGVGGAGMNIASNLREMLSSNVRIVLANTDAEALEAPRHSKGTKIQLGKGCLGGKGAGANAELGKQAAIESAEEFSALISDASLVIFIAGMGSGTGSGATPVLAKVAMEVGIPTVVIVTMPFDFEGKRRMDAAMTAVRHFDDPAITLFRIPNQLLLSNPNSGNVNMSDAFKAMDEMVGQVANQFVFASLNLSRRIRHAEEKHTLLLGIQRRIREIQAKRSEYKDLEILDGTKTPVDEPQVGIWWLYKGRVIQHSVEAAICPDPSDPQCVEVEHIYVWPQVQQAFASEIPELLELKYDDVSRGRVWYHREFERFSIACAPVVANDPAVLQLIANAFGIGKKRYRVIVDPQYPR